MRTSTAQPIQSKPGPRLATVAGANAATSLSTGSMYTLPGAAACCALTAVRCVRPGRLLLQPARCKAPADGACTCVARMAALNQSYWWRGVLCDAKKCCPGPRRLPHRDCHSEGLRVVSGWVLHRYHCYLGATPQHNHSPCQSIWRAVPMLRSAPRHPRPNFLQCACCANLAAIHWLGLIVAGWHAAFGRQ